MGLAHNPKIVTDGLVLYLDAANPKSYPGSGTTWYDLSGNGNNFTNSATGFTYTQNNKGSFLLTDTGNTINNSTITTVSLATVVFWIKTSDTQSLFLTDNSVSYLGAYRSGNKEYHYGCGTPVFYMDTVDTPNIYDYAINNNWHMLEFKNVNFQTVTWPTFKFNTYTTYTFGNGELSSIMIYNRSISELESKQNFNATRSRYGI